MEAGILMLGHDDDDDDDDYDYDDEHGEDHHRHEILLEYSVVIAGTADGSLYIYLYSHEEKEYSLNQTLTCSSSTINSIAVGPYKKHVVAACGDDIMIYEHSTSTSKFELIQSMEQATDSVMSVSIDADEKHIAAGSSDGKVRVYAHAGHLVMREVEVEEDAGSYIGAGIGIGLAVGFVGIYWIYVVSLMMYCVYTKCINKAETTNPTGTNEHMKPPEDISELDDKTGDLHTQNKSGSYN